MRPARWSMALVLVVATASAAGDAGFEQMLACEGGTVGGRPESWKGGPPETFSVDDQVVHGGKTSVRIERTATSAGPFSALTAALPVDFAGRTLELRGFMRTDSVDGWCGLWLRQDGEAGPVAFDNMQDRRLAGTTAWTEYRIELPLSKDALEIYFGALVVGTGKAWVDDLQLLVDGKAVAEAPRRERPKTALDTDTEFDAGSKITIDALTPVQQANLVTLGRTWGFLKYHHPKVTSGALHWDYELFRVMPRVLAANDAAAANTVLAEWIRGLGDVPACTTCATLPGDAALKPDIAWISDRPALGETLSALLENIHRNRAGGAQSYVAMARSVGNPEFRNEKAYATPDVPDAGRRILALFRWWNVVQYWSPYRDVIGSDWNAVLPEFLPRMVAANTHDRYASEMFQLVSRLHDGHANLWSRVDERPPRGACSLPVTLREVEGRAVVTSWPAPPASLRRGDVVTAIDGVEVETLMASWAPWYSASNDVARRAAMVAALTRGPCGPCRVKVARDDGPADVTMLRGPGVDDEGRTHDLPGPTFRLLSPHVAYLKLSSVKVDDIADYLKRAEGTRGLIIDIRNYPSEFVVFALGGHLVKEPTPFVRFTAADLANPGAFLWSPEPLSLLPLEPYYPGRVVAIVDEASMSQAEYTALAFGAAPNAMIVGSTTAGADGNVSAVPLPGGMQTMISGLGVFHADRRPTQRVGIVPDVASRPTIASIREGRDEVLETAIRQVLGPGADESVVRATAKGAPLPAEGSD